MVQSTSLHPQGAGADLGVYDQEGSSSGVSWSAVIAGAFVTASLSLVLLALGTGLGLSSVSPWANSGVSASTVGKSAIAWLILIQIIASALGGYLAGRLRTKWAAVHTDEVYFRDTAHGFLVWAVAVVLSAAFLSSAATTLVGGQASQAPTSSGVGRSSEPVAYAVDTLLRPDRSSSDAPAASVREEVGRIFLESYHAGRLSDSDKSYVAQMVAAKTGISPADADQRVSAVFHASQEAADATRKATAHFLLWLFLALLIGAFCASYAATLGGRQRDSVKKAEFTKSV